MDGSGDALFEYVISDHLGNSRVVLHESGSVVQEDHYYPFGLKLAGLVVSDCASEPHQYTYNGKELEDDHGLWWYHYGVRYYDPQVARWMAIDPADQFYTPYAYVGNDPVNLIDPDGAFAIPPDIVLRGTDGHEIRFVTPDYHAEYNVPIEFGYSQEINLSEVEVGGYAYGYQYSASLSASGGVGTGLCGTFTAMEFPATPFQNYWYPYLGGEAFGSGGVDLGGGVEFEVSFLFAVNVADAANPESFAGTSAIHGLYGDVSGNPFLDVGGSLQLSVNEDWYVLEAGLSASINVQTPMPFSIGAFTGAARTGLLVPAIPTNERSWPDRLANNMTLDPVYRRIVFSVFSITVKNQGNEDKTFGHTSFGDTIIALVLVAVWYQARD